MISKKLGFLSMIIFAFLVLALAACGEDFEHLAQAIPTQDIPKEESASRADYRFEVPLTWDREFITPPCSADSESPLLDEALSVGGLSRNKLGISKNDLAGSPYHTASILDDEARPMWLESLRANPAYVGCFEGEVVGPLEYFMKDKPDPVASTIRHAAVLLGASPEQMQPSDSTAFGTFEDAIIALCATVGECGSPSGELPPELAEALTPIVWKIISGIEARKMMDPATRANRDAEWWRRYGGNSVMLAFDDERPDPANDEDRAYLLDESGARRNLFFAAAEIASAVELADLSRFAGLMNVEYDLFTQAGWIQIRDSSDNEYPNDGKEILLRLDLGGNDIHLDPVASNVSAANSVSIDIDLSGRDIYTYESYEIIKYDMKGLVPTDRYGRYEGDERFGNVSASTECRQGAGRNGIALLFNFGDEDDHFQSLRCSQGYAHIGVGGIFVEGGNNTFLSETTSQGSGQFGIAFRIIGGKGKNTSFAFSNSQGFGYVQGAGIDISGSGDDTNICDPGDPDQGGIPLYYTPQLPGKGNSSFCQGAGMGMRGDDQNWKTFLSGGIGIKLDLGGNNTFVASVFAQAVGYWQGTGILEVRGPGNNTFDALWYAQGSAAHYSVGMFFRTGEGKDVFNGDLVPVAITLGTGHDFSIGTFVKEKSDAIFHIPNISAGASNCNGIGLFVSNGGHNKFIASNNFSGGVGNVKCSCAQIFEYIGGDDPDLEKGNTRDWCIPSSIDTKSIGLMIAVGDNEYEYPESSKVPAPSKGKDRSYRRNDSPLEYGAHIDRKVGETGIHAESSRIR